MNKELADKIKRDFPELCSEDKLPSPFVFGFETEDGWFDLIYNLCKDISAIDKSVRIAQVKEKYGGLRFYVYSAPDKVFDLIDKAEEESYHICECCGEEGKLGEIHGWWSTLCDSHFEERKRGK